MRATAANALSEAHKDLLAISSTRIAALARPTTNNKRMIKRAQCSDAKTHHMLSIRYAPYRAQ